MRQDLKALAWASAGQLTEALARHCGLAPGVKAATAGNPESACLQLGIEADPVHLNAQRAIEQLSEAAPFVVGLPGPESLSLGVVGCRRGRALVLAPDLAIRRVELDALRDALCREAEAPLEAEIDRMLESSWRDHCSSRRLADSQPQVATPERVRRARAALLRERLGGQRIGIAWQLRVRPGSSFSRQLRESGVVARMLQLAAAHVAEYVLWLVAWWMIGSAALSGRIDWGWLAAWLLTLATIIPVRIFANWSQSLAGIGLGGLLKQRLVAGALELSPEHIRRQGAGQLLGCALEAETVESLALTGGLSAAVASLEVVLAAAVLAVGAGGSVHALLLVGWMIVSGLLTWRFGVVRSRWTTRRLEMTHDLVERMSGHRTRLAQLQPERWHDGEDQTLDGYLTASKAMDRHRALLTVLVPRGWLLVFVVGPRA